MEQFWTVSTKPGDLDLPHCCFSHHLQARNYIRQSLAHFVILPVFVFVFMTMCTSKHLIPQFNSLICLDTASLPNGEAWSEESGTETSHELWDRSLGEIKSCSVNSLLQLIQSKLHIGRTVQGWSWTCFTPWFPLSVINISQESLCCFFLYVCNFLLFNMNYNNVWRLQWCVQGSRSKVEGGYCRAEPGRKEHALQQEGDFS